MRPPRALASTRSDALAWTLITRRSTNPAAIIVAAGRGERAGSSDGTLPKQLRPIAGRPAAAWAVDVLLSSGCAPVVVALPPDRFAEASALLAHEGVAFVPGGETRQDSVRNALEAVTNERIVIHDGARPFAETELVNRVLNALDNADAAIPVLLVDDTLKEVDGDVIVRTVDRSVMRRVQTPQAFRADRLRAAHEEARRSGFVATDDAQLVEMSGGRVVAVEGQPTNIKLTRPGDFEIAELYARR